MPIKPSIVPFSEFICSITARYARKVIFHCLAAMPILEKSNTKFPDGHRIYSINVVVGMPTLCPAHGTMRNFGFKRGRFKKRIGRKFL